MTISTEVEIAILTRSAQGMSTRDIVKSLAIEGKIVSQKTIFNVINKSGKVHEFRQTGEIVQKQVRTAKVRNSSFLRRLRSKLHRNTK